MVIGCDNWKCNVVAVVIGLFVGNIEENVHPDTPCALSQSTYVEFYSLWFNWFLATHFVQHVSSDLQVKDFPEIDLLNQKQKDCGLEK